MTLSRPVAIGAFALALIALPACKKQSAPDDGGAAPGSTSAATPLSPPTAIVPTMNLDEGRLESRDCATVATFYGDALRARQYQAAARAWGKDSNVDAPLLERHFDGRTGLKLDIGEVAEEGAAGSLYCTAQVTLRDSGKAQPGTLTLRRVNNVPGATVDQLRWHIVQSTLGEGGKPAA